MTTPERRRYNVGCVKIPYAARDVAHAVLTPVDDRAFLDLIGADTPDDHHVFPIGSHTTYSVELTDGEAEQFRAASNCRYVELDGETHTTAGAVMTPAASSMRFMRADFPRVDQFHGRDVLIAILDAGTTKAVRDYLGVTMAARRVFSTDQPGTDEITAEHGCLVAACCLPRGGKFLDVIVTNDNGTGSVSGAVAGARWAADNGAKVINYSSGAPTDDTAWHDMMQYLLDRGVQFFSTTGNDGANTTYYPGGLSASYANAHCAIAFDEQTGQRASFSNYVATASGCAPGTNVLGFLPDGRLGLWNGTSAAAPHMALLCAMGATGGRFTTAKVGAALKANCRDTGQPAAQQGGGAYDLAAALTALGAFNSAPPQVVRHNLASNPSVETDVTGYALRSTRPGITATIAGRSNTLATPCGTFYLSVSVTGDGTTNATTPALEVNLPTMPVTAGQTYTWSVHSRHQVIGPGLQWAVQWQDDAGANLGTFVGATSPLLPTVWARYLMTLTAPTGATKAVPWLRGFGFTATTANSWRIDGLLYEAGEIGPYFDGSSSGAKWDGTANLSTSTLGTVIASGADYHPVAIIWPASENSDDGEYDLMESSRPGDDHAEAFLHYPRPAGAALQQEHVTKAGVDLTQWHNFAFEKTPDGITGYLDGVQWFHYAGGAIGTGNPPPKTQAAIAILERLVDKQPIAEDWTWPGAPAVVGQYNDELLQEAAASGLSGNNWTVSAAAQTWLRNYVATHGSATVRKNIQDMPAGHLTLQLDNFTGSSGLTPAKMEIDWVNVYSLTPQGGGGGSGGGGTGTLADRLRLGFGPGLNKFNIGVDFLPGQGPSGKQGTHVDYYPDVLTQNTLPPELAGYLDLRDDGAVRFTSYVGAATTPNSTHSRTESRGLAQDGKAKQVVDTTPGGKKQTAHIWADGAVIRAPKGRPNICIAQWHTSSDDLCQIQWQGGTVISTYGDEGRPGTLATGVAYGSRHQWMIMVTPSEILFFWDDMVTAKARQSYSGSAGLYGKIGNYHQSTTSYDDKGEQAVVDFYDLEYWASGDPEPAARH